MLPRRFLATAFGMATLICAAGLAIAPGAASAGAAATGRPAARPAAAPRIPSPGGPIVPAVTSGHAAVQAVGQGFSVAMSSQNWSGYAVTSPAKFTYAQSRFVQPTLTCPGDHPNEWASNWVGFDGFSSSSPTVEQDGTAAHCGGPDNTRPVYKAWYEMYPKGSVNVFSVNPGDTINTSASYSHGTFTLTVSDLTSGKSATHTATCASCKRNSAEWIIERPELCTTNCFLTRLADFGTTSMSAKARVAGVSSAQGIPNFRNYIITMMNSGTGPALDTIGKVSSNSFAAVWENAGTTVG
ncbi:MAG TPA: G1 family glutamic endopeptidase [Streptosporangiaceae bacterium]|nr:G1 family glutamic endopeptidase [Streptosporangiaceae bacterium]